MNPILTKQQQAVLIAAAKAAGRSPDEVDDHGLWFRLVPVDPIIGGWIGWNAFANSACAFGLAVQLRLQIGVSEDGLEARADTPDGRHWTVVVNHDPEAALREAIVHVAALQGGWVP